MAKRKNKSQNILSVPKGYRSLAYGVFTVVALFIIIFLGLKAISQRGVVTDKAEKTSAELSKNTHEVKEGESLWAIAEKNYNDGYKWTEIAKANNIANPNVIEKGMKLVMPEISEKQAVIEQNQKITENSYTVVEGDNLWTIAVRAYGDGYKWVDIARENKLSNPDVIHPGNEFKLPR